MVPTSEKEPEGWSAADKITVVLESAGHNGVELTAYCRERSLYPEQIKRWRQAAQDPNEKASADLERAEGAGKLRAQDHQNIKALKKKPHRKEKGHGAEGGLAGAAKKWEAFCSEDVQG